MKTREVIFCIIKIISLIAPHVSVSLVVLLGSFLFVVVVDQIEMISKLKLKNGFS